MGSQSFIRVARACWVEAATWAQQRADAQLISFDDALKSTHNHAYLAFCLARLMMRFHRVFRVLVNSLGGIWPDPCRASTIASIGGRFFCCKRKVSLAARLMRFRSTARLTCFLATIKPSLGPGEELCRLRIRKLGVETRMGASLNMRS